MATLEQVLQRQVSTLTADLSEAQDQIRQYERSLTELGDALRLGEEMINNLTTQLEVSQAENKRLRRCLLNAS